LDQNTFFLLLPYNQFDVVHKSNGWLAAAAIAIATAMPSSSKKKATRNYKSKKN